MHRFPGIRGCLMLSAMDKHRCANAFSDSDASFRADDIDAVAVIVRLRLREELHIGVHAVLESKGSVSSFA